MVTMTYNGLVWKRWSKIMGKTFDEWWEETRYIIFDYAELNVDFDPSVNFEAIKKAAEIIWKESLYNMTTRDI